MKMVATMLKLMMMTTTNLKASPLEKKLLYRTVFLLAKMNPMGVFFNCIERDRCNDGFLSYSM